MRLRRLVPPIALGLALAACGAAEDAPSPENPLPAATCPALEEIAPNLLGHLRAGRLDGIRVVIAEALHQDEVGVLLDGVLRLLQGLRPGELSAVIALKEDEKLLALVPLLADLVRHVAGDPSDPGSFRDDVVAEAARLTRDCDFGTTFSALDAMLGAPELPDFLEALAATLEVPLVQDFLGGAREGAVGQRGFLLLVGTILERLATPGFDFALDLRAPLAAFDELLPIGEPPLSDLLDALESLLARDGPVFTPLQDLTCCYLYGAPTCESAGNDPVRLTSEPALLSLVYELFVTEAAGFDALLIAVADIAADAEISRIVEPLRVVLGGLAEDPDVRAALVRVLEQLLEPSHARQVVPELLMLLESGATTELLHLAAALIDGCDPR